MNEKSDVLKIKLARRQLLMYLNIMYPISLKTETLYRTMLPVFPDYEYVVFQKDIHYLVAKEFLCFIDDKFGGMPGFSNKVVGLTAKGKEIAERTQTDPALEI